MKRHRRYLQSGALGTALAIGLVVAAPLASAQASAIVSPGPLTSVTVTPDLNCDVDHSGDTHGEWYGETACGTFLAVDGVLYGPRTVPMGGNAAHTPWTAVSQSATTGSGTPADPYTVVTVVAAGSTGVTLTQTDQYVVGLELYTTSVTVTNGSPAAQVGYLYTAGDCYLQDDDNGYGNVIGTSPACVASLDPNSRIEQLLPRTPGNTYYEASYGLVWSALATKGPLPNTDSGTSLIDNGIAIGWPVDIAAGAEATFEWSTVFSPTGVVPLTLTATADDPSVWTSDPDGYTITVANQNRSAVTADTITVTLPEGFVYTPGSTTGATTTDPTVAGRKLTFTGPFTIASGATITVHFDVTASATPGSYTIDVAGTAQNVAVESLTAGAPVAVLGPPDLGLVKEISDPNVIADGTPAEFLLTATNYGTDPVNGAVVSDSLPAGLSFVPELSSPECTAAGTTVTCAADTLAPGDIRDFSVVVVANADATAGPRTNTATISAEGLDDRRSANNTSSVDFAIRVPADPTAPATVTPTSVSAPSPTASHALPRTGADVAPFALGAVALIALGAGSLVLMRRRRS